MAETILGIIVFIIAILALVFVINNISFNSMVTSEVKEILDKADKTSSKVDKKRLENLPELMKKYLSKVIKDGADDIKFVRLRQSGKFRTDQKQGWRDISAEQYLRTDEPEFIWRAKIILKPLLTLDARDKFNKTTANMMIKILSTINLFNESHERIYQSSLLRYFSEMVWFPSAFIDNPHVIYKEVDSKTVVADITYQGIDCRAVLHFDDDFLLNKITTKHRYMNRENEPWTAYYSNYKDTGKYMIPTHVEAEWELPHLTYKYADLDLVEIDYNVYRSYRYEK